MTPNHVRHHPLHVHKQINRLTFQTLMQTSQLLPRTLKLRITPSHVMRQILKTPNLVVFRTPQTPNLAIYHIVVVIISHQSLTNPLKLQALKRLKKSMKFTQSHVTLTAVRITNHLVLTTRLTRNHINLITPVVCTPTMRLQAQTPNHVIFPMFLTSSHVIRAERLETVIEGMTTVDVMSKTDKNTKPFHQTDLPPPLRARQGVHESRAYPHAAKEKF